MSGWGHQRCSQVTQRQVLWTDLPDHNAIVSHRTTSVVNADGEGAPPPALPRLTETIVVTSSHPPHLVLVRQALPADRDNA